MNEEKSELTPSQDFIFIGIRFCTRGTNVPPPDRIVKILSRIGQLSGGALKFCQAREFLSLLGLLNSAADTFHTGGCTFDLFKFSYSPNGDRIRILWIGKFHFQNPCYEKFGNYHYSYSTTRAVQHSQSVLDCWYLSSLHNSILKTQREILFMCF
jgi:hypothetical protein